MNKQNKGNAKITVELLPVCDADRDILMGRRKGHT